MRRSLPCIPLTLILVAVGSWLSCGSASAADARWTATGTQVPGQPDKPVWSFAVSRLHPSIMLAATEGRGVLRSSDAGATWSPTTPTVEAAWVVRFDPRQPTTAYAGTQAAGLLKSIDEGKTWTSQSVGLTIDVRSIDVLAGTIVVGTSIGVYDSTDGAATWHPLGLTGVDVSAVALLAKPSGFTVFAGADNGNAGAGYLLQSEDLTGSWRVVKGTVPSDATVATIAVAATPSGGAQPPVIAGTSQGMFRSDDRGVTWNPINGLPPGDINLVVFNPANPDQIYAGSDADQGNGGVFRSLDRGASWSALGAGLPARPRITALALQTGEQAVVLAASWNPTTGQAGAYRIPDSAASVAGTNPSAAPSATSRSSATPRATAAPLVVTPRSTAAPAYGTYVVAAAVLAAIGLFVVVRRWRLRREDRRTYAP
ncbi:MAG: hypothetical protein M3077_00660 [Candidatus Dormibacteraeota bacterium]|nr:hypothetical protein [Candidatus Dormibacteraeota bacterium]MDQ6882735.1 hypothetical protein [Candidatus Dormibacteraeota bacterium]